MNQNLKEEKNLQKIEKEINNNGITLIALVITIIVLLILAGVTINLTLGENGIFKTAEMAGKNYTQAQEQELAGLAGFENTIDNIIAGTVNNEGGDQEETTHPMLKDVATPGAYVKYDTGIAGLGENQDGIVTFRVLYNDSTYGLQIISDRNVENVTLGGNTWEEGRDSYNNAIATLNEKAEYYAESSPYALDGRCVGSVPTVGADGKFNAKNTENIGPVQLQFSTEVEGANNMKGDDTNYTSNGVEGIVRDKEAMETIGLWKIEEYWLASRTIYSASSNCDFGIRIMGSEGGRLCSAYADYAYSYGNVHTYGLRPVISLNPNVKVISGDGTSEGSAYELAV